MRALVLAATAVVLAQPATAFEHSGFRSGMTLAEAQAVANQRGLPLVEMRSVPGVYMLGNGADARINMTFCGDTLFSIYASIDGGFDAFAQLTKDFSTQLGQPQVQATSGYTEAGLASSVSLIWYSEAGEEVNVIMNTLSGNTNVSRGHSAFETLCPQPS